MNKVLFVGGPHNGKTFSVKTNSHAGREIRIMTPKPLATFRTELDCRSMDHNVNTHIYELDKHFFAHYLRTEE
jgi:hypothetical protein